MTFYCNHSFRGRIHCYITHMSKRSRGIIILPKVSVIVPVYKVEKYLERCVDSLLNQDFRDYEIILIDDGSPDDCPLICDDYAETEEKIKVIHKKNGGLSDARNYGVNYAKGEYVIFVDSDDYVENNHISSLWNLIEKNKADIGCSPPIIEYENIDASICKPSGLRIHNIELFAEFVVTATEAQAIILRGYPVGTSAWAKIIKREYCLKHPFPKGKVMEELATTFFLVGEAKSVAVIGVPTYHYVQRKGSILHSSFTLEEIEEYMALAEGYIANASTDDIKSAAAVRIFLLGRRLGCSVPNNQEGQAYQIINRYCRRYFGVCFSDKKISPKEKIRLFLMSISSTTLKLLLLQIQRKEEKKFRGTSHVLRSVREKST